MANETIAAVCAWRLYRAAEAAGIDPAHVPAVMPLKDEGLESRISLDEFAALWEALMRSVRDPGLPIRIAEAVVPADYDAVGLACMTRATFGEAMRQAVRFARIWTDASHWVLNVDERVATLEFQMEEPFRLGVRCGTESFVAEMIHGGRTRIGFAYTPAIVRFRHARPRDVSAHERFFGCPIEWSAPRTEVAVPRELFDRPFPNADPIVAAYFERHAVDLLARFGAEPESIDYRIRSILAEELRSGVPALDTIARRLAMSSRTLRRRLQEAGTNFQNVLDSTRCELAKRYLDDPAMPIGAVGFMVGFAEPSAFHRAFRRWTGKTPLAYRRAAP